MSQGACQAMVFNLVEDQAGRPSFVIAIIINLYNLIPLYRKGEISDEDDGRKKIRLQGR